MIKKILLSVITIIFAGSSGIAATNALIQDNAVLGTSTYSTDTVDLKIKTDGNDFADSANGFSNIKLNPGESVTHTVFLQNNSNVAMALSGKATDIGGTITPDKISIKFVKHNSDPVVMTSNSSMTTWSAESGKTFGTAFNLAPNSSQEYDMVISLDDSAADGNFNYNFTFTGKNVPVSP